MVKAQSLIESVFTPAVERLAKDESGNFTDDLYVQADVGSGGLQTYDGKEYLIEKTVIFGQVNSDEEEDAFNKRVVASMEAVSTILPTKNILDVPRLMKPPSVSLTGEDFVVIEEPLLIDGDMLRLDDPLLKDLDADLDDSLANLLVDVK